MPLGTNFDRHLTMRPAQDLVSALTALLLSAGIIAAGTLGCTQETQDVTTAARLPPENKPIAIAISAGTVTVLVTPGTDVQWINVDPKSHSVTSTTGLWDSGALRPGESFRRRFDEPGVFHYRSVYDRTVKGTITVRSKEGHEDSQETEGESIEPSVLDVSNDSRSVTNDSVRQLNAALVPEWKDLQTVQHGLRIIRDARVPSPFGSAFEKLPWEFIEEGCSPRAALASGILERAGLRRPAKVFVFGDLSFSNERESAFWWYHVALIVSVEGTLLVLDPSLNGERPLRLAEFMNRILADPAEGNIAICNPFAYQPESRCFVSGPEEEESAILDLPPGYTSSIYQYSHNLD